jgi:large subunit ribosomal protein L1
MGKKYVASAAKIQPRTYKIEEGFSLLKEAKFAKFDESVDLAISLGVDPKQSDQMVRGSVILPHGTGRTVRILVFAKGEKEKEATLAGADYAGMDDLIEKINGGWLDFDVVVATPDTMASVGKLGKVLGPRGLMPNPKSGTVTFDVARAIREIRHGKSEYRTDKGANIHLSVGRASFTAAQLVENASAVLDAIIKAKPSSAKGKYMRKISISSTMGPSILLDSGSLSEKASA